jgi:hypothetical protein
MRKNRGSSPSSPNIKYFGTCTHQQTIEEFMDKKPHGTDQQIQQMIQELHIQNHGSVASGECSTVAHKTHQKDDFIANLRTMTEESDGMDHAELHMRTRRFSLPKVFQHQMPTKPFQDLSIAPRHFMTLLFRHITSNMVVR